MLGSHAIPGLGFVASVSEPRVAALQEAHDRVDGIDVRVGVPGVYGHVDIGGYATPPPVLYRQPVYGNQVIVRDASPTLS